VQQELTRRRGSYRRSFLALLTAVALVAGSVVLAACGGGDDDGGDTGGSSSTEPIGVAGLEGALPEGGPDFMKGMKIATAEINKSGGVDGRKIELEIFKTGGTPEGAASAYKEAGANDAMIGAFLGATGSLAIREQSERVKLPLIAASGNDAIDVPVTTYVFQNSAGKEYATSSLVYLDEHGEEYAKQFGATFDGSMDGKKVAVLHYETDFSQQIPDAIEGRCEELGCEVVAVEEAGAVDAVDALTPQLTKMESSGADVFYIESLNPNALAAAKQLGMDEKPIIAEQWLTVPPLAEAAGKNAEGVVFGGHKCRAPDVVAKSDPAKKWCEEYVAKYEAMFPGEPFALFSIYGYDAVLTYADAAKRLIEDGEEVTRDNIVTAMEEFDGSGLRTSHGLIETSPDTHRLTGDWTEAYVDMSITIGPDGEPLYEIAPGADPAGANE
jgi:branched-chain amino acid transport system substrate-binding protein